jgi:hypothetical protein
LVLGHLADRFFLRVTRLANAVSNVRTVVEASEIISKLAAPHALLQKRLIALLGELEQDMRHNGMHQQDKQDGARALVSYLNVCDGDVWRPNLTASHILNGLLYYFFLVFCSLRIVARISSVTAVRNLLFLHRYTDGDRIAYLNRLVRILLLLRAGSFFPT